MARGRRPESPEVQRAKGSPGRRKGQVEKREAELQRIAALLASDSARAHDPLAVPALIDKHSAAAVAIWRDLAPRLARTHRLQAQHRLMFATFCVYLAEWVMANEDVLAIGQTQTVTTVSGDPMERIRPMVIIRDRAHDMVMKLSQRFGLTPADEYALFKDQSLAAAANPGLFDERDLIAARQSEVVSMSDSIVGALAAMDSEPPRSLN